MPYVCCTEDVHKYRSVYGFQGLISHQPCSVRAFTHTYTYGTALFFHAVDSPFHFLGAIHGTAYVRTRMYGAVATGAICGKYTNWAFIRYENVSGRGNTSGGP